MDTMIKHIKTLILRIKKQWNMRFDKSLFKIFGVSKDLGACFIYLPGDVRRHTVLLQYIGKGELEVTVVEDDVDLTEVAKILFWMFQEGQVVGRVFPPVSTFLFT